MSNTLVYTHQSFAAHEVPPGHVEHPGRYQAVYKSLCAERFSDLQRYDAPLGNAVAVALAHPTAYFQRIENNKLTAGLAQLDADTFMGPSSFDATMRAVGAACDAVDRILAGEAQNAFVVARPPGHHAEPDRAMGFCLFNNAAVAALYARQKPEITKVAVVDFDVHHGNGTEAIFWDDENAFFASSHEWPQYPGTGRNTDRGSFDNIANAPLPTGTDGDGFRRAWGDILLPALADFDPDFIVISAGFDAHRADPLGGLNLTEGDFTWITDEIAAIAKSTCSGRIVSLLEGGYDLGALGASAAAHVKALMEA